MYQNVYCNRKDGEVFVWDDITGMKKYSMESFQYAYKRQVGGKFQSIYGDELIKVNDYNDSDPSLFSSDIPIEMKVLMDLYPENDEPSQGHKIGVIDIEVSTTGGFPDMETTNKKITGISLFDYITKTCFVFILDEDHKIKNGEEMVDPWLPEGWKITTDEEKEKVKIVTKSFDDEDDLLISFMDKWQECILQL